MTVTAGEGDDEGFGVARYEPDGALDPSFGGGDGFVIVSDVDGARPFYSAGALARQPDGKLVVAGTVGGGGEGDATRVVVMRLLPDGRLDRSFDGNGSLDRGFGRGGRQTVAFPGRLAVVGSAEVPGRASDLGAARLPALPPSSR